MTNPQAETLLVALMRRCELSRFEITQQEADEISSTMSVETWATFDPDRLMAGDLDNMWVGLAAGIERIGDG